MTPSLKETSKEASPSKSAQSHAFIYYRPPSKTSGELVYFNEEARQILSYSSLHADRDSGVVPELDIASATSLCAKWASSLEAHLQPGASGQGDSGEGYIEILPSYRRRYAVRGLLLTKFPADRARSSARQQDKNYLFILERITTEDPNVSILFRQKKLSRREQQIIQYLLRGYGNKEIASHLSLSENTIKGYMKLLMRKLGVDSRSGILALLLAKTPR